MKILLLDIESAPNVAHVWGLWQQNVGVPQIIEAGYVLCWAAKWYGEKEVMFDSIYKTTMPQKMLRGVYELLNEADVVVHYNGKKFDIPTLNKEFVIYGFKPPAPYKQVDLLSVARSQFKFASNKLVYVSKVLGLEGKYHNPLGHELWINCMNGDSDSWKIMETYNKQDVVALEQLYVKLLPWIKNHPNQGLYQDKQEICPSCGSSHYQRRGTAFTKLMKYSRFQCVSCGTWFRSSKSTTDKGMEKYVTN